MGDGVEASFPSTIVKYMMVASDNNKFQVEMWRGNTKNAASIPVTITGTAGKLPQANRLLILLRVKISQLSPLHTMI
ncbi:hypothetical protein MASR1M46_14520 [Bacteroidales bacterium]